MNPLIKKAELKEKKALREQEYFVFENENIEIDKEQIKTNPEILKTQKEIQDFENSLKSKELGVFYKLNFIKQLVPEQQIKIINDEFYFKNYQKNDGEWINNEDILCHVYSTNCKNFSPILSHKSGYLEYTKKYGDLLNDQETLSVIHEKGKYKNENSADKTEFKHYYNYDYGSFDEWLVLDGDFVNKNQKLYQYHNSDYVLKTHKSEKEGYINILNYDNTSFIKTNELLYLICEDDTNRINSKFANTPKIIIDDFTNSKRIEWENVSANYPKYLNPKLQGIYSKSDNNLIDLMFTFNYIDNKDYIVFHFNPKQIKPKENEKIHFLFENNEKIEFLISNPISLKNNKSERVIEVKSIITAKELAIFKNQKLKKWKLSLENGNVEILGGDCGEIDNYKSKYNLVIVINKLVNEYISIVKNEIRDYKPLEIREFEKIESTIDEICFVYLMQDTSNNYFKIGISNKPKYREKTLQSEKPTIELLIAKKFPVRKIAESFEKALHETYSEKRIRGEWFNLNKKEVENIKTALS